MDKAEIEKILEDLAYRSCGLGIIDEDESQQDIDQATSFITSLIIKWLEGKRASHYAFLSNKDLKTTGKLIECRTTEDWQKYDRNQLITELIGEVRG